MKAYKITLEQKAGINGQKMEDGSFFNPVLDKDGNWFIFEQEHQSCGFGVEADFVPPLPPEELL